MNYTLTKKEENSSEENFIETFKKLFELVKDEKKDLITGIFFIILNNLLNLTSPLIIGIVIDKYIKNKDFNSVLYYSFLLLIIYLIVLITSYTQTKTMGTLGQKTIFNLRNKLFLKLNNLPIDFFNKNKIGDLISRINNDTSKLSQFLAQSLVQFIGNIFLMIGSALFLLSINFYLGLLAILPSLGLLIFNKIVSRYLKERNKESLRSMGSLNSEIQESLNNFKVIDSLNIGNYFKTKFGKQNENNFKKTLNSEVLNAIFVPTYTLSFNIAQIIVLYFGISLIIKGDFSVGLFISLLTYVSRFYEPIRHLASIWSYFQMALAGWSRISEILLLKSNLEIKKEHIETSNIKAKLEFKNVSFSYSEEKVIIKNINLSLEEGKTYALVGPTGGGKTTIANLMARLYDPLEGTVFLDQKDIKSYENEEKSKKIGFILQEPFLFTGTLKENILYGNDEYINYSDEELKNLIKKLDLDELINKFENGLNTNILSNTEGISLGEKQIIAFIRALLRKPEIIILDEASANIDTITEKILEDILNKLPKETIKVIIAHRLNTIQNANKIFFVNSGYITSANSIDEAIKMFLD
ncbi:MAG: ABC transporter ATP-binding protein [Candidatus Sericytochromatia bacterium]